MITIAGRRVKFAAGRGKTQSVNICTAAGTPGSYDWVLVVDGPQIGSEDDLAAFPGDTIEGFVAWVKRRYRATERTSPAVVTTSSVGGTAPTAELETGTATPGILAGVDAFIDRCLGLEHVGQAPHHRHRTSSRLLSEGPPSGLDPATFLSGLYALVERNGRASTRRSPSSQNWRLQKMTDLSDGNTSPEKRLEKAIARDLGSAWTNQMPTASGLVTSHERQRNVDLVHRIGPASYAFLELKVNSDTPLFAMMEILKNGMTYLYSRRHRRELGYIASHQPPLWADTVHLRVLAPADYYRDDRLGWLEGFLNRGLEALLDPRLDGALAMDVSFRQFTRGFDVNARGPALADGVERAESVWG